MLCDVIQAKTLIFVHSNFFIFFQETNFPMVTDYCRWAAIFYFLFMLVTRLYLFEYNCEFEVNMSRGSWTRGIYY